MTARAALGSSLACIAGLVVAVVLALSPGQPVAGVQGADPVDDAGKIVALNTAPERPGAADPDDLADASLDTAACPPALSGIGRSVPAQARRFPRPDYPGCPPARGPPAVAI